MGLPLPCRCRCVGVHSKPDVGQQLHVVLFHSAATKPRAFFWCTLHQSDLLTGSMSFRHPRFRSPSSFRLRRRRHGGRRLRLCLGSESSQSSSVASALGRPLTVVLQLLKTRAGLHGVSLETRWLWGSRDLHVRSVSPKIDSFFPLSTKANQTALPLLQASSLPFQVLPALWNSILDTR